MDMNKSSISESGSLEQMGEFWDTHDFTDFDNPNAPDVVFRVAIAVPVELDLLNDIENMAKHRGVSLETLVNLWLKEKLIESKAG